MLPPRRDSKFSSVYPKALGEWLQLDYFRRRGPLRRWRTPLGLILAIACVALMVALSWAPGGRRAFQAAPVSEAHAMFNDHCAACHDTSFKTATRLVRGDAVRSVSDEACLLCHDGPRHQRRQVGTIACAVCHREHQGTGSLARVDDRQCTACHADLASHTDRTMKREYDRDFRDVRRFDGRSHPPFDAWQGKTDPGTIRFSHRAHLKPEGVPVVGSSARRVLECRDCHRPDQEHRYMQPIRYQRDCASCHPLAIQIEADLKDPPARDEATRFQSNPAPHPAAGESAGTVRAEVRERLIRFIQGNPAVLGAREHARKDRPIPGRERRNPPPVTREEWTWVGNQLTQVEHGLFDGAGGCRLCHTEVTDPARRPDRLPRYAAPGLNARWFPHSTFRHDSHRELDCQQCHSGAGNSEHSSQILMPTIAMCQQCHNASARGARSDCVACHDYHDRREESHPRTGLTIEEALAPERYDAAAGDRHRAGADVPHRPGPQP
jgi:hypothetical protein